jgi:hypothetical protein
VGYLAVHHAAPRGIDWEWLAGRPVVGESEHVRHVRCETPLAIRLDGRTGRGAVWRRGGAGG